MRSQDTLTVNSWFFSFTLSSTLRSYFLAIQRVSHLKKYFTCVYYSLYAQCKSYKKNPLTLQLRRFHYWENKELQERKWGRVGMSHECSAPVHCESHLAEWRSCHGTKCRPSLSQVHTWSVPAMSHSWAQSWDSFSSAVSLVEQSLCVLKWSL